MLSDNNNNCRELHPQKGLQIKEDDKFFSRLMSKETSMANSSSRIYYGGASVAVPFMWESEPGTPKHPSCDNALPPLTPPPSYHSSISKSKSKQKKSLKPTLLSSIFPWLIIPRENHASPSSSWSSTSSSSSSSSWSWSSLHGSGSSPSTKNRKLFDRRRRYFSCSKSPVVHNCMDDDDEGGLGSPTSALCFGVKRRNLNKFRGLFQ